MKLRFQAVHEETPADKWKAHFEKVWPDYNMWFLREGDGKRPGYMTCRRALQQHMPELVPLWEHLGELGGGGDQVARMLSLYCPTPYLVACSQALWTRDQPVLVRNYDYHPARCEGLLLMSAWHGTRVIASSDSLWGVLDGMNEHGLAVTLAFGGRRVVGEGFGIPLVLRYILEFCKTVAEGVAVLQRVPSHMAYTIGLLDATGNHATVYVNPDQPTEVTDRRIATNHQNGVEWAEHADLTRSLPRADFLEACIERPEETVTDFISRFLETPVVSTDYSKAFGTLYTAAYWPATGQVEFRWPNRSWHQSFDRFVEGVAVIAYPAG